VTRESLLLVIVCAMLGLWLLALTLAVARLRRAFDKQADCVAGLDRDLTDAEKTIKRLRTSHEQLRRAQVQARQSVPPPPVRPPVPGTNPIPRQQGKHAR
jgi:hypothetical protein